MTRARMRAQVIRWCWVSPLEVAEGTLPGGYWWSDVPPGGPSLATLREILDGKRVWDAGWKIALRLGNGQLVYAKRKPV